MPKGVTDISNEVYGLHMLILYICIGIGVVVFGAMFWSYGHIESPEEYPATFHESTKLEAYLTIVPLQF